jgi:excisionase family DNA binding protein
VTPAFNVGGVLEHAVARLAGRLVELEPRLDAGDAAAWVDYCRAARALAAVAAAAAPGADGRLLTTREMAAALHVSPKTVLRKRKAGELAAVQFGQRGRAALRWRADQVAR